MRTFNTDRSVRHSIKIGKTIQRQKKKQYKQEILIHVQSQFRVYWSDTLKKQTTILFLFFLLWLYFAETFDVYSFHAYKQGMLNIYYK